MGPRVRSSLSASALSAIHAFVSALYLEPARLAGEPTIDVRIGHVQACLKSGASLALICSALESPVFSRRCGVKLLKRSGPSDGPHTLVTFKILACPTAAIPPQPGRRAPSPNRRR
jgi:hypothetical protein